MKDNFFYYIIPHFILLIFQVQELIRAGKQYHSISLKKYLKTIQFGDGIAPRLSLVHLQVTFYFFLL